MIDPEKSLDEALKKSLQLRFNDLEAVVKPSLWTLIKREIPKPSNGISSYVLGTLLLLFLIMFCYKHENVVTNIKTAGKVIGENQSVHKKKNVANSQATLNTSHSRSTAILPVREPDALLLEKTNRRHERTGAYVAIGTRHSVAKSHSLVHEKGAEKVMQIVNLKDPAKWAPVTSQTDAGRTDRSFFEGVNEIKPKQRSEIKAQLLKKMAKEIDLPSVCLAEKGAMQSKSKLKAFDFLCSVTPLQTYQILDITSSATNRFQNFRFAPMLSLKSKGIKLSTGIQKKGIQLLVNYSFIRNWTYYEVGNGEVVVDHLADDQYNMTEKGDSYIKNERLHMFGAGIRKIISLKGPMHAYALKLGADYAKRSNEKQGIASINFALIRPVAFFHNQPLSIGPFAELGLNQRMVSGQIWKYRPYQFGISVDLKINNSYIKTLF